MFKSMIAFFCVVLIAAVSVIAAYFEMREKLSDKQKQIDDEIKRNEEFQSLVLQSNRILTKNNEIIETQNRVIDTAAQIIGLQKDLNEKNKEIQDLQNYTVNNVTGGNTVPKLIILVTGGSIKVEIDNDGKFPLRNVSIQLTRVIYDFMVPNSEGQRQSNNPETYKIYDKTVGDIPLNTRIPVQDELFPNTYKSIWYRYEVKWLTGFYVGGFFVKDENNHVEILNSEVSYYTKGLTLNKAVRVNNFLYAKVAPYKAHQRDEKVWVR